MASFCVPALARLGYQVTLIPPGDGHPLPQTDTTARQPGDRTASALWTSPDAASARSAAGPFGFPGRERRITVERHSGVLITPGNGTGSPVKNPGTSPALWSTARPGPTGHPPPRTAVDTLLALASRL
jgi:hypothetical protein